MSDLIPEDIFFNGGSLRFSSRFSIVWFMLIMSNFGGPFSYNLLREIILIISLSNLLKILLVTIVGLSFFSATYSIILYRNTQQGQLLALRQFSSPLENREFILIIRHVWPLFLLPMVARMVFIDN